MNLSISRESFKKIFSQNVYEKIVKESVLPYSSIKNKIDFNKMLDELYNELISNNYSPLSPVSYVFLHKSEFVARIIPILHARDEAFYYFICKYLENDIAENRVPNTFGGWRLGTPLKEKEQEDILEIEYVYGSYQPWLWSKNWKEFVRISRTFADSGEFKKVIKLDVSNFYDSINLNILESKLMQNIEHSKIWAVPYLLYFLKYWNKKIDDYQPRSMGLPQTEFGDQSRLLANFYLQSYDSKIKTVCDEKQAEYVRYADDQLIFLRDEKTWQEIMLTVNSELNKLGLNLNAAKTKMLDIDDLSNYYLYEPLSLLDDGKFDDSFNMFYDIYTKKGSSAVRYDTYLKRITSKNIGLNKFNLANRAIAKELVLRRDFIIFCNDVQLNRIYQNLEVTERDDFVSLLWKYTESISFNSYFYFVLKFFDKNKLKCEAEKMRIYINDHFTLR